MNGVAKREVLGEGEGKEVRWSLSATKSVILRRFVVFVAVMYLFLYHFSYTMLSNIEGDIDEDLVRNFNTSQPATEIFEVTLPHPDFGEPVYSQPLLSHVFGNSWGKPLVVSYKAPPLDIKFNKVIVTLNTTVAGVQYDRLLHLYLDGILLWRTSTIEPGGKLVFSTATKDVSVYAKLFSRNDIPLMFQLDNLVNKKLTGEFNVSLYATYYNAPLNVSIVPKDYDDELSSPGSKKHFFGNSDAADQIWSMVHQSSPNRPPLVYQPSNDLTSVLPRFNANTTRAKVELFMSGNAAEEFWYSNVLDSVKDSFKEHNHPLLGHGPCRIANIYLNDMKIATLAPEPVVYTGGISPLLWRPIVATGAFDVRALEVELTPLLPLLWESPNDLRIEIGNCIDDDTNRDSKPPIGENWITTANILTWESDKVESSSGEFLQNYNQSSSSVLEIGGGGYSATLSQIVKSDYETFIQGALSFNLTNGSSINVISDCLTSMEFSNIQLYSQYGDKQEVVSLSTSHHSFSLLDADEDSLVSQTNISHNFPFMAVISTKPVGRDIAYDVTLLRGSHALINFNGDLHNSSILLNSIQNGTSSYYLSPNGNHGTGRTEHRFRALTRSPLPSLFFKRHVLAENGEVLKDDSDWNDEDFELSGVGFEYEIRNKDQIGMYHDVLNHFTDLLEDGLLDATSYDYMVSRLVHSINDEFGIGSIPNDWSQFDKKALPQQGLFQRFI